MSIAAVLLMRERRLVERFRASGASSPDAARSLHDMGVGEDHALHRLRRRAVVREAAAGAYYLDEPSWLALRGIRRRFVAVVLLLVAIIGGLVAYGVVGR